MKSNRNCFFCKSMLQLLHYVSKLFCFSKILRVCYFIERKLFVISTYRLYDWTYLKFYPPFILVSTSKNLFGYKCTHLKFKVCKKRIWHSFSNLSHIIFKCWYYTWQLFAFFIVCKNANNFTICLQTNKQFANNIEIILWGLISCNVAIID